MIGTDAKRHRFDVEEYRWMGRVGILSPDDRVELVNGEVVEMTPIGSLHQSCVDILNNIFIRTLGDEYLVRVQGPIRLGDFSEPQPDVAVLKSREDFYRSSHPTAEDAVILVEVSDSTLAYDRKTKLPLYASGKVREVWILDLQSKTIEVHTEPSESGYSRTETCGSGDDARSAAIPSLSVPVKSVFG